MCFDARCGVYDFTTDKFRQKLDRYVAPGADIDRLALPYLFAFRCQKIGANNIAHMRVIAGDGAVAEYRHGSAIFFCEEECPDGKCVGTARIETRPIDIEIAQRNGLKTI